MSNNDANRASYRYNRGKVFIDKDEGNYYGMDSPANGDTNRRNTGTINYYTEISAVYPGRDTKTDAKAKKPITLFG